MKQQMKKNILRATIILVIAISVFAVWYKYRYSMNPAKSFEINKVEGYSTLLIATQGSEYKDLVIGGVIRTLKNSSVYIKVIDVHQLSEVDFNNWDCILISHTWEMGVPPKSVSVFIESNINNNKIITLSTSGEGTNKIEGVDGISSASVLNSANNDVSELSKRIKKILGL